MGAKRRRGRGEDGLISISLSAQGRGRCQLCEKQRGDERRGRTGHEAVQIPHVLIEVVALITLEVCPRLRHELPHPFISLPSPSRKGRTHLKVPPNRTILPRIDHLRLVRNRNEVPQLREVDERELFDSERGGEGSRDGLGDFALQSRVGSGER